MYPNSTTNQLKLSQETLLLKHFFDLVCVTTNYSYSILKKTFFSQIVLVLNRLTPQNTIYYTKYRAEGRTWMDLEAAWTRVQSPHCHCWVSSSEWPVHHSLPWPFPFTLELQQMVEVCSRAPAIGECVRHGLVLRCHWVHHGAWSVAHVWDTPAFTYSLM